MRIIELIYLYLPAYIANMTPLLLRDLMPRWRTPLDFGYSWRGVRIFGNSKTWKGMILGVSSAVIVAYLQRLLLPPAQFDYSSAWYWWGSSIGLGALVGDAVKSFFKRRMGIRPGMPWIPFDQMDYAVGALIFGSVFYFTGWLEAGLLVVISIVLHFLAATTGFYLGVRTERW